MTIRPIQGLLSRSLLPALLAVLLAGLAQAQRGGGGSGGTTRGAPEIDPSLAAAGIVLLVGGTLVLTGRRRAKTA